MYKQTFVILTALACEARPLLDRWRFKQIESSPFPIYYEADKNWLLIVSDIGKKACATAVGYLGGKLASGGIAELAGGVQGGIPGGLKGGPQAMKSSSPPAIWVNFGICGHGTHALGKGMLVHKILDAASGDVYYPFRLPYFDSSEIHCHDKIQTEYPPGALVDMESAAFFYSASKFSDNELIHLYKVVSDNDQQPLTDTGGDNSWQAILAANPTLNPTVITKILEEHTDKFQEITDKLRELSEDRFAKLDAINQQVYEWMQLFIASHRFSSTRQQQLADALRACYILGKNPVDILGGNIVPGAIAGSRDKNAGNGDAAKHIISSLQDALAAG